MVSLDFQRFRSIPRSFTRIFEVSFDFLRSRVIFRSFVRYGCTEFVSENGYAAMNAESLSEIVLRFELRILFIKHTINIDVFNEQNIRSSCTHQLCWIFMDAVKFGTTRPRGTCTDG